MSKSSRTKTKATPHATDEETVVEQTAVVVENVITTIGGRGRRRKKAALQEENGEEKSDKDKSETEVIQPATSKKKAPPTNNVDGGVKKKKPSSSTQLPQETTTRITRSRTTSALHEDNKKQPPSDNISRNRSSSQRSSQSTDSIFDDTIPKSGTTSDPIPKRVRASSPPITTTTTTNTPPTRDLRIHRGRFVTWNPDTVECLASYASTLAVARASGQIELWSLFPNSNTTLTTTTQPTTSPTVALRPLYVIAAHPKSSHLRALCWWKERLFGGALNGSLFEVDLPSRCPVHASSPSGGAIWSLAAGPRFISAACEDGRLRLYKPYDIGTGLEPHSTLTTGVDTAILSTCWHRDDQIVYGGGRDGIIRRWDVTTSRLLRAMTADSYTDTRAVWSLDCGHDDLLASGHATGMVMLWNAYAGVALQAFNEHHADVLCVRFSPDGYKLYASGIDSRVAEYQMVGGSESMDWVYTFSHRPHTHDVRSLATLTDGATTTNVLLVSGGVDAQLCWYSVPRFELVRPKKELPFGKRVVVHVSDDLPNKSPSQRLVLAMHPQRLELWHVVFQSAQFSHVAALNFGDDVSLRCSTLSKSCRFLAAGDTKKGLRVFALDFDPEAENEIVISPLETLPDVQQGYFPTNLEFAGDSLIVGYNNGAVVVLDISQDTGNVRVIRTFDGHGGGGAIQDMTISNDNAWFAVADAHQTTHIYSLDGVYHHVSLSCALFGGAAHAAFAFEPKGQILYVARMDGRICGYLVEEMRLVDWIFPTVPSWEKVIGFCFNPNAEECIYVWSCSTMSCFYLPGRGGGNGGDSDMVRVTKKSINNAIHVEFVGGDEMFSLEMPWINVLKNLPPVMDRKLYGT